MRREKIQLQQISGYLGWLESGTLCVRFSSIQLKHKMDANQINGVDFNS